MNTENTDDPIEKSFFANLLNKPTCKNFKLRVICASILIAVFLIFFIVFQVGASNIFMQSLLLVCITALSLYVIYNVFNTPPLYCKTDA